MIIGDRLREVREKKGLSQGDIEHRTGLLRCYISRVENGHTTPAVGTLEKFARAMEIPLYQLFYDGDKPPEIPKLAGGEKTDDTWGSSGENARLLSRFRQVLAHLNDSDRDLLLYMAQRMTRHRNSRR